MHLENRLLIPSVVISRAVYFSATRLTYLSSHTSEVPNFIEFSVDTVYCRDSLLFRWRCNRSCFRFCERPSVSYDFVTRTAATSLQCHARAG